MLFNLERFIENLSQEMLNLTKKNDLLAIAEKFNLTNVKPSKSKS